MDEVLSEFLLESAENLEQADHDLEALKRRPDDPDLVNRLFRVVHTIKGTCGFLGFSRLESLTHLGENLLASLRDGGLRFTPSVSSVLQDLAAACRRILASIEEDGTEGRGDYTRLVGDLERALRGEAILAEAAPEEAEETSPVRLGDILLQRGLVSSEDIASAIEQQRRGDPRRLGEILVEQGVVESRQILEALQSQGEPAAAVGAAGARVRVDVDLLDRLMNLAGELALARNDLSSRLAVLDDPLLSQASRRLGELLEELKEVVTRTRMLPVGSLWDGYPRMVEELAESCGKMVRVEMEGRGTELDRAVIEGIKDPLTHLVRNAVDHGIETPARRREVGKPEEGRLALRALQEGGRVVIEVADDGAGIDVERIKRKLVGQGLLTSELANRLSDEEAVNLIFLPGFSTARKVTSVSGRGVGMDVVKTKVARLGGTVEVVNSPGEGSTFRLKIPLSLALLPALIVAGTEGDRFAVPRAHLREVVPVDPALRRAIRTGAVQLRGEKLPIVDLDRGLGLAPSDEEPGVAVLVIEVDDLRFGLQVADIRGSQEIVVRPLGWLLDKIPAFSGATVMGDGGVVLILDLQGLARHAGLAPPEAAADPVAAS